MAKSKQTGPKAAKTASKTLKSKPTGTKSQTAAGGAVASYKIERRERPSGDWMLISLALESEATLNNQERGKDWEYRVIAVNKAGEGMPSNTVAAVV